MALSCLRIFGEERKNKKKIVFPPLLSLLLFFQIFVFFIFLILILIFFPISSATFFGVLQLFLVFNHFTQRVEFKFKRDEG